MAAIWYAMTLKTVVWYTIIPAMLIVWYKSSAAQYIILNLQLCLWNLIILATSMAQHSVMSALCYTAQSLMSEVWGAFTSSAFQ